jgi:putative membrane-bound dehydrogenase-like protein
MTLPPGFQATLFAGEPDVVQPIAFAFDDRGRLWVAECYSYPKWHKDGSAGRDRILIFEDRDGDGRFDSRKVFFDRGTNVSGLQLGFGGVWLCATPNLLFLPDRDGDDMPDGPPEVVLDGWDLNAKHNVFNALTWGPDGWLYGGNGILSNSRVGRPGTPDAERVALNCGVWRYHPTGKQFELVATGTTNPWGLDFDDYGQLFITNCVIHHVWHVVPGGHYQRMHGQDFNPHWYTLMASCADHIHWGGGAWQSSRGGQGSHDDPGGGHAHAGCMVYLGDNWPEQYRNGVFLCNIHGNRVNYDRLERRGSGYVARHAPDFLRVQDTWFRGLGIQYGPDGGVYVSDWTDTGECHDYDEAHKASGRIYKITHGKPVPFTGDLAQLSDAELVRLQLDRNDWHVRHARRLLQERAIAGKLAPEARTELTRILREHEDVTRKLRALWALHATGGLEAGLVAELLASPHEHVRGWAIRLGGESCAVPGMWLDRLASLAARDSSPFVRLCLASLLQRLTPADRWAIATELAKHAEDAADLNLPLLLWYGIEPLVSADGKRALSLLAQVKVPLVREYLARRITLASDAGLAGVVGLLGTGNDGALQRDVLRGLQDALAGRRDIAMPSGWAVASTRLARIGDAEVRERVMALGALFGDARALASLRKTVTDPAAPMATRQSAMQALLPTRRPELLPLLQGLLADPTLRGPALRGLAAYNDQATPKVILARYASFTDEEKADAVQTLASRPAYALALLDAVEAGQVPRRDLSAFTVRQMLGHKHTGLTGRLNKVWGALRPASAEKAALVAKYKAKLTPDAVQAADRSHGRQVFARSCGACHRLFDDGGTTAPDLTGAQRDNLDYVLENLIDPNGVVYGEYQVTLVETKDGRIVHGVVKQETDKTVTLQSQNDSVVLLKDEIATRTKSQLSLMPEGLLTNLKDDEIRDLIAYLASPRQVPLPNP